MKYASKRLRAEKEIVSAAIQSDKRAKSYVSDRKLLDDDDIKKILE